jgi:hypothetical protein
VVHAVKCFVCDSKSVSVCSWLECDCVICRLLCESVCVCVCYWSVDCTVCGVW